MYYNSYYYFDWTYLLVIAGLIITFFAQIKMRTTYEKYKDVQASCGMTGAEAAKKILMANGVYDVTIRQTNGSLTDNYDPRNKTLNLSVDTFAKTTVEAICVAAHECGHAIQDNVEYFPLKLRGALVPVANIGSRAAWLFIILGVLIAGQGSPLVEIGIVLFSVAVGLELVTLPVEFNASGRAMEQLNALGILTEDEQGKAKKVLSAAALTYVAAAASGLLQLLRIVLLFGKRDRR